MTTVERSFLLNNGDSCNIQNSRSSTNNVCDKITDMRW